MKCCFQIMILSASGYDTVCRDSLLIHDTIHETFTDCSSKCDSHFCFVSWRSPLQVSTQTPSISNAFANFFIFFIKIQRYNHGTSRSALRPTQPPIQWVPEALSLQIRRPGREAVHSRLSRTEIKNDGCCASITTYTYREFADTNLLLQSWKEDYYLPLDST
jgi:hypothetical protein